MSDRSARIAILLGLAPLVVAVFWFTAEAAAVRWQTAMEVMQVACVAGTVTVLIGVLLVWRPYVHWTRRRLASTGGLAAVVVLHLVVWQPIWAETGCAKDTVESILNTGQGACLTGLWCAACGLCWWGTVALRRRPRPRPVVREPDGRRVMPISAVRLTIGLALIPFLPGAFFLIGMTIMHFYNGADEWGIWIAYEVCAGIAVSVWLVLWRPAVTWTPERRRMTWALAGLLIATPTAIFLPSGAAPWECLRNTLPLYALSAWFVGTALSWRGPAVPVVADAAAFDPDPIVRCAQCDYSLRGLREVRCPECGWASTVDDIVGRCVSRVLDTV